MLAFGALVGLGGARPPSASVARLRDALASTPGRVSSLEAAALGCVHVSPAEPVDFDRELPSTSASGVVVMGALRLDDRDRLRRALRPDAPGGLAGASDARLAGLAYEHWGERFAEHLMGDYAFCVWDAAARRLTCVRDHHGNRSLFWGRDGERFVVSTAIEGVRSQPALAGPWREDSIASFLHAGWVQDPHATVWRDTYRLPRATTMTVTAGAAPRFAAHWAFPVPSPIRYRDDAEYVSHFSEVLGAALRDRLRARSAVIHLSGGMDSATIAATAQGAAPGVTLFAQTIVYPALAPSDDDRLAPLVAQRLGIAHDVLSFDDVRALAWLDDAQSYPAQPIDEPNLGVTRVSSRDAARRASIAVIGEDGDTLLRSPTLLAQLRSQRFGEVAGAWWTYWRRTGHRPWVGLEWRTRLRRALGQGPGDRTPWLRERARRLAGTEPVCAVHPVRPRTVAALTSGLWDSFYEGLSPSVTGAELLVTLPLVDPRVIAFIFAIPPVPWGQHKQIMRAAMQGRLPAEVLARPKMPFGGFIEARVAQWRAAGGVDVQLSERVAPWVDRAQVSEIFRTGHPYEVLDAWRVLILDRWLARVDTDDA